MPRKKLEKLLRAEDRVLCRLGYAEFHNALGRDLDLLARGGIAADTCFAVDENELPKAMAQ